MASGGLVAEKAKTPRPEGGGAGERVVSALALHKEQRPTVVHIGKGSRVSAGEVTSSRSMTFPDAEDLQAQSPWRFGVRRTGAVLEIRHRWQGFFGPNAWLTIPFGVIAGFSLRDGLTRPVCDPTDTRVLEFGDSTMASPTCDSMLTRLRAPDDLLLSSLWIALGCTAALAFVGFRFFPVVQFGTHTIRWRNWFRWKEIPTSSVQRFSVTNYNARAWVPAVTAEWDTKYSSRSRRFIATLAFRREVAELVSTAVAAWAADHSIDADLPAELMVWSLGGPQKMT